MVNIDPKDIFLVNDYRVSITKNGTAVYFLKDIDEKNLEIEHFVENTKPIVKYLFDEGFITKKSVKVYILSNK